MTKATLFAENGLPPSQQDFDEDSAELTIGLAKGTLSKIGVELGAMAGKNEQIAVLAEEIMRYLCIHPEAADTAEGIERWWLPRRDYEATPELVEEALERLLQEGVVIETLTANGIKIYRRRNPGDNNKQ